ncbi:hypothetical protein AVDCRST_MAG81-4214 [uncultured Synechococcales cyanobacterium]|uniref:Uncharacterized protein n=1 Tax=uncultured Synechococcales cyanobacterium TaxID=1936017 RepID=A0A6J4VSK6_9CYAN|nr:hypothetical protein AVDCRST_MAG81-4214 [uncultured Synechococcales cyanobacterium]
MRNSELGIFSRNFDASLVNYKPQSTLTAITPITPTEPELSSKIFGNGTLSTKPLIHPPRLSTELMSQ